MLVGTVGPLGFWFGDAELVKEKQAAPPPMLVGERGLFVGREGPREAADYFIWLATRLSSRQLVISSSLPLTAKVESF